MNKKRAAIMVGHFGPGTGASIGSRDEWSLAIEDARFLVKSLDDDGIVDPVLIAIDYRAHPWDIVQKISRSSAPSFLGGLGNIDARAVWARRERVAAAIELHLNRSAANSLGLVEAQGHEVWIRRSPGPKTRELGTILIDELDSALANKSRGLRQKNFRILRALHDSNIPAAIIEPGFLSEDAVVSKQWRAGYLSALKRALYRFFNP